MLDDLGLVHMNGRIYDPLLGRFLSADLIVDGPGDLQGYNRYSYVKNRPLSLTDPSGFASESDRLKEENKEIVKHVLGRDKNGEIAWYRVSGTDGALVSQQVSAIASTLAPAPHKENRSDMVAGITGSPDGSLSKSTPTAENSEQTAQRTIGPGDSISAFRNVTFSSTFLTWLKGDSKGLISKAKEQLIELANSRVNGQLTEAALAIRAIENNNNGAKTNIEVTSSTDVGDFRTVGPESELNSYVTYNPAYKGIMPETTVYENGITLLAHEISHARDYALLRSEFLLERNSVDRMKNSEFEAVRVENQIRSMQKLDLRTVYEFREYYGGTQPVPSHDKYAR
jgi:RHS repeat-associated protein